MYAIEVMRSGQVVGIKIGTIICEFTLVPLCPQLPDTDDSKAWKRRAYCRTRI